jgi:hypothetical protein
MGLKIYSSEEKESVIEVALRRKVEAVTYISIPHITAVLCAAAELRDKSIVPNKMTNNLQNIDEYHGNTSQLNDSKHIRTI